MADPKKTPGPIQKAIDPVTDRQADELARLHEIQERARHHGTIIS